MWFQYSCLFCILVELSKACTVGVPFLKPFSPDFRYLLITLLIQTLLICKNHSPPRISLVSLHIVFLGGIILFCRFIYDFSPVSESLSISVPSLEIQASVSTACHFPISLSSLLKAWMIISIPLKSVLTHFFPLPFDVLILHLSSSA